jgi:hypothetical protein
MKKMWREYNIIPMMYKETLPSPSEPLHRTILTCLLVTMQSVPVTSILQFLHIFTNISYAFDMVLSLTSDLSMRYLWSTLALTSALQNKAQ